MIVIVSRCEMNNSLVLFLLLFLASIVRANVNNPPRFEQLTKHKVSRDHQSQYGVLVKIYIITTRYAGDH